MIRGGRCLLRFSNGAYGTFSKYPGSCHRMTFTTKDGCAVYILFEFSSRLSARACGVLFVADVSICYPHDEF